jgi:alpha-galactosidase
VISRRWVLAAALAVALVGVALVATRQPADRAPTIGASRVASLTPPMGWNSWNRFGCDVSAALVEQSADALVSRGLAKLGYDYVVIDDCWMANHRDARTGRLLPDPVKFPQGIAEVARYVHARGLKLGIYEDAGTLTCAGFPGSLGHEELDARTFAEWGVDYLKYDNCHHGTSTSTRQYIARYTAMRQALDGTGRPILFAICEWGVHQPWTWAPGLGQSWRTTHDIADSYASLLAIFRVNVQLAAFAGPGGWNDPDMLEIGNGGMTATEERTEFTLWAAMAAPLIAGTDLRTISQESAAIYANPEVVAIDQDPLGRQAVPVANDGRAAGSDGLWVLNKPLADGGHAVVLFNSTDVPATISTTTEQLGLRVATEYAVRDVWSGAVSMTSGKLSAVVAPHAAEMYRIAG